MFKIQIISFLLIVASYGLKKRPLAILVSLELLCLLIVSLALTLGIDCFFGLMLLCLGACEGVVGLGSLIARRRIKVGPVV